MPRSGLSFDDTFAWREAAHWAGGGRVTYWEDFCQLDSTEQSEIIAHWMARMHADAVMAQDMERKRAAAARRKK